MRRALLLLAFATTIFAPAPVPAYVRSTTESSNKPLRWMGSHCVMMRCNSKGSKDVPDGRAVAAATRSMENWNKAVSDCAYIALIALPASPDAEVGFNPSGPNENVLVWVESGWEEEGGGHDRAAAALTTVSYFDNVGEGGEAQIFDADIELNGELFAFSDSAASGAYDIENTVTHELGHVLGLDHNCVLAPDQVTRWPTDNQGNEIPTCKPVRALPASIVDATMFPTAELGETKKRTPKEDDSLGICDIYPMWKDPGRCESPVLRNGGGCATAGAQNSVKSLAPLVLLLALLWSVCRRRR